MDFLPLRKEYELVINIKKGGLFGLFDRKVIIKYKQATIKEMQEFLGKKDDLGEWLIEFLKKNSNCSKKDIKYLLENYEVILSDLNTRYLFVDKSLVSNNNNENQSPFSSFIVNICNQINETPNNLVAHYTLEQILWLTKGVIWNINETTKEGQMKNKQEISKQKVLNMSEEKKKQIDNLLSKI